MTRTTAAHALRAKILGTLLQDARRTTGHNLEACAHAIGVTPERYQAYELGHQAPSLPELEGLAYFWEIPIEHFWSNQTLEKQSKSSPDIEKLKQIRQKIIGVMVRQSRLDAGLNIKKICELTGIDEKILTDYEAGLLPIPIPELEAISDSLNRPIKEFFDKQGPIGAWNNQQQAILHYSEMPPELQIFVSKPVNRPYLELAQRLSKMSVDKLRSVAEILLEITY
ncbi:MAG TPA: helix-turn-helix transcriptional regulator [Anaerolineales bacterium]|nr:helix-turn-helix transcriptional regulator [Anaerolineales bacterium]